MEWIFSNNEEQRACIAEKLDRVRKYMGKFQLDAIVLGTREHFAWLTNGGNNELLLNQREGCAYLFVSKENIYLVSMVMDGQRILDEEIKGMDVEPVFLTWLDKSVEEKIIEMAKGKNVSSDINISGLKNEYNNFFDLHYPLLRLEKERIKWLGKKTDNTYYEVASKLKPGMTGIEIKAILLSQYIQLGISCDVVLIAGDERIANYRHATPSQEKIYKRCLLHTVARKWGLHCNVTRMVCFEKIPKEMTRKYKDACRIQAETILKCREGISYISIYEHQKKMYEQLGYKKEWERHYHGGITGYTIVNTDVCTKPNIHIQNNQAFDWFVTLTGVKSEELILNDDGNIIIPSVTNIWPTSEIIINNVHIALPEIIEI